MADNCTVFKTWTTNSRVIRATAPNVTGPYTMADVVHAPFAHNPTVRRLPDGSVVLWMIGGWPTTPQRCGSQAEGGGAWGGAFGAAPPPLRPASKWQGPSCSAGAAIDPADRIRVGSDYR